jgi:hypothetical protein
VFPAGLNVERTGRNRTPESREKTGRAVELLDVERKQEEL